MKSKLMKKARLQSLFLGIHSGILIPHRDNGLSYHGKHTLLSYTKLQTQEASAWLGLGIDKCLKVRFLGSQYLHHEFLAILVGEH